MPLRLSAVYERHYASMLKAVSITPRRPAPMALFWPKVGSLYDGDLLIVGRAVNGWIDRWEVDDGRSSAELAAVAEDWRRDGQRLPDGLGPRRLKPPRRL